MDNYLFTIAGGRTAASNASNQLIVHLKRLNSSIKNISIRDFYASLEQFQSDLEKAKDNNLNDLQIIDGILASINELSSKYK